MNRQIVDGCCFSSEISVMDQKSITLPKNRLLNLRGVIGKLVNVKVIGVYVKDLNDTWFGVACDDKLVYGTTFASQEKTAARNLAKTVPRGFKFEKQEKVPELANRVIMMIKDVYDGRDINGKASFYMDHLPVFTRRVIEATYRIPVGYATSYGAISEAVGGGARAVGNVMAMNPFCPLVPCHRVVCSDLSLGGYSGGRGSSLQVKLSFLKREKRGYTSKREIQINGSKLHVFPVELVLQKAKKH